MAANLLKEYDVHKLTGKKLLSLQPNNKKKLNMTALLNRGIMAAALLCLITDLIQFLSKCVKSGKHVLINCIKSLNSIDQICIVLLKHCICLITYEP